MAFMAHPLHKQTEPNEATAQTHLRQRQNKRMGPRPLPLHLMTALCVWRSLPFVWPNLKSAWPSSSPLSFQKISAAAKLIDSQITGDVFVNALNVEAASRLRKFINGIRAYQDYPEQRDVMEASVVWRRGTTKLRDYNPAHPTAPIILVVPSLINRFHILDLDLAPSFLRTLALHGFRPLVVDWDAPGEDENSFGLDDYVARLKEVVEFIQRPEAGGQRSGKEKISPSLQPPVSSLHLLGYCMGGLLALALASQKPHAFKTLTLMATPWDFHEPQPKLSIDLQNTFASMLDQSGHLPVDVLQSLFTAMQPMRTLEKFMRFAAVNPLSMEARKFVLVEDWLNDGVPLTSKTAKECIAGWYGNNHTAKNMWRVAGQLVDPRILPIPSYVLVPGKDTIVPPESALPLAKLLPHATLHEPMAGHIGLLAGRNALQQIWMPMIKWLKSHD